MNQRFTIKNTNGAQTKDRAAKQIQKLQHTIRKSFFHTLLITSHSLVYIKKKVDYQSNHMFDSKVK